ncbi:MAG TPA: ATP-binding cassette domain-containing protein [Actinomycetales bacterium]|nr:ATP-binding cassette domain-containing protein [Actinomycetales bacterium]
MTQITARGWGWRHSGRRAWALRGVDLDVGSGERVLLLGPSGAGKSTLLAAVAGLLDPGSDGNGEQEGTLLLDGVPADRARTAGVRAGRARTGLLLQDPEAQTVLARCGDDVAFGLENHAVPPEEIWPRVDGALDAVGLGVGRDHPTARLSGGQRQRLALAGVLALRPEILLMDEPTSMLDPDAGEQLAALVGALLSDTRATCLLVEHRVAMWLDLVDRVVVLEPGGGVVADGPSSEVLEQQGAALAARGVWVPGHLPTGPARRDSGVVGEVLLRAENLQVSRRGTTEPVLSGVDLDVVSGRATALVGPNGSGKSTLALALSGLARHTGGDLVAQPPLLGEDTRLAAEPERWRPRDLVRRIGSVFQDPRHQFVASTVSDELAVGPRRIGLPESEVAARTDDLLERLRLVHLARANPFTLSGGEQRRVSVATALATRPRLLVLDEPTFGQDARTWAELVALLAGLLDDGAALVTATHDGALVDALADDVLTLRSAAAMTGAAG